MPARSRVSPEFGKVVRQTMGQLSQSKVALQSEISVGYINRMVRGTVPSREIILRLAEALKTHPASLLAAAGYSDDDPESSFSAQDLRASGRERHSAPDEVLGADAAAQYYRQCWDRYVAPVFPDAEIPSGAGLPLSRSTIRSRVIRILGELIEEEEK